MRNTVSDVTVDREKMLVILYMVGYRAFRIYFVLCCMCLTCTYIENKRAYRRFVNSFTSELCQQILTFKVLDVIDKIGGELHFTHYNKCTCLGE